MNKTRFAALSLTALVLSAAFAMLAHANTISLNGAGATFPYPLYSKWFSDFKKSDPTAEINYQSIGSGGGIRQLLEGTIDFGASDAPMKDEDLAKAKAPIYHFPTVLGAVVITYNLAGVTAPLKLSSETIADLFLGKITKWNDPKIAAENAGVTLPNVPVMIVHRSDGSGTTAVFTDYLSKVSPDWKAKAGQGTAIKWPIGLGAKGNEGVTGMVKSSPGAIGYVELLYAEQNKLAFAHVKNAEGVYVKPEPKSITQAANGALKDLPKDFRVSIVNAKGKDAYPISSFTYLLVYKTMPKAKGEKLKKFLSWAYDEGQKQATSMFYAPLPASMLPKVKAQLAELVQQ